MEKYDLVVCGGGTAGSAAGYIAAKNGLKTLIVEKNIHLGGSITSALVMPAMKSNTMNINCEFFNDFINELKNYNAQITYSDGNQGWFNPELSKIALDSLMKKVGCDVLFDTEVTDVQTDEDVIKNIKLSSKMLSLYIESSYFVDATGDGNFSVILKNKILKNNQTRQPMTMRFHISGIDLKKFSQWILKLDPDRNVTTVFEIANEIHLSTACTWDSDKNWALQPLFKKGIEKGILREEDTAYFQIFTIPAMPSTVSLNCPRILQDEDIDPLDPVEKSKAFIKAREQIWRIYCFLKAYFPGFENSFISNIADMQGVRESRRVCGKKIYTKDDIISGKSYETPVLHANYPIDIHSHKKDSSVLEHTTIDYELPVESLIASDYRNLLIVGRCLSADFEAQAALRIQTSCFSMGEAAAKYIALQLK
ncbi:MAG: FAD-dependent oxidoreductase [Clostridium sp.]|nr:FAD-dependent oxidoreductase [Clostridium sp.]